MKLLQTNIRRTDVLDVLAGDSKIFHFPYYTDETLGFFDHLIHHGALQEDADGIVSYPISSFRNWLMEQQFLLIFLFNHFNCLQKSIEKFFDDF